MRSHLHRRCANDSTFFDQRRRPRFVKRPLALLYAVGLLALTNATLLFPTIARAQGVPPPDPETEEILPASMDASALVDSDYQLSSTGHRLLLLSLGLAGLLAGMERMASWRLGVLHQVWAADKQKLAFALGLHDQPRVTLSGSGSFSGQTRRVDHPSPASQPRPEASRSSRKAHLLS